MEPTTAAMIAKAAIAMGANKKVLDRELHL